MSLRTDLERLRIGQTELGRWIGKAGRSIRAYCKGERPVPGELELLMDLLTARPELVQWCRQRAEARGLEKRQHKRIIKEVVEAIRLK
jgi:hypothetical protein